MKRFILYIALVFLIAVLTCPAQAQTLFTNDGQTVTVTAGAQLTIDGDATNNGVFINQGSVRLSGDWINSDSYISDAGTFILNSSDIQRVDHGGQTFYILQLEGGGRKIFDSDIEIISSLILLSGVAEVPTDRTFLLREGVSVTGGSDEAYIEGMVFASGTGDLLFPVGRNGSYAPVTLLDISGTEPVLGMTVVEPNPVSEAGTGISEVSTKRYWSRETRSGTFVDSRVRLALKNETVTTNTADAVVAGASSLGGVYTSRGQSSVSGTAAEGSVTSSFRSSDRFFSIGRELNEGRLSDSLALLSLYNNNPGEWISAVNWDNTVLTLDDWTNIELNAEGRVTSLVIEDGKMGGTLTSDIRLMTALQTLDLSGNELSGAIPGGIIQLVNLETLDLSGNSLQSIPDMSTVTTLTTFDVRNNNLLFESLESNNSVILYDPQDSLAGTGASVLLDAGEEYIMSVPGTSENNSYQWFLNDDPLPGATSATYSIENIDRNSMGVYYCEINNSVVQDLTLFSKTYTVFAEASVAGTVSNSDGTIATTGSVTLLRVTKNGAYTASQSLTLTTDGTYVFSDTLADYVVLADPEDLETYIPTYHERAIQWDLADVISLDADTTGIDITLEIKPEDPEPGDGNGALTGDIFTDFPEEGRIEARRRVRRVGVALRRRRSSGRQNDDEFELYAYTQTDDDGMFSFGNLPTGVYRIYIEFPGIPIREDSFTEFELGADLDENAIQIQAVVFEDGIAIERVEETGIPYDYLSALEIYPNPATGGNLFVRIAARTAYEVRLELTDLTGVTVLSETLNHTNTGNDIRQLDISDLSSGLYIVRVIIPSYQDQIYKTGKILINGR